MNTTLEPKTLKSTTHLPDGLVLRNWSDDSDWEEMRRILTADKHSQNIEEAISAADLQAHLESMVNMDVKKQIFIVEADGKVVAYATFRGYPEASGVYTYLHHGFVQPEYKKRGIGLAMIRTCENAIRSQAAEHTAYPDKTFQVFVDTLQTDLMRLLEQEGYKVVRNFYTMLRPNMENIPDMPLPAGLEVRPVKPEQMHQIWEADIEAFSEHWGEMEPTEDNYARWLKRPLVQPELWQIAWDGDRIAGFVLNMVDQEENSVYNRQRGFTDDIGTIKAYRGRGLAQALITRGLKQLRDLGMTEAGLDVDTENSTGALRLYEKLGYRPIRTVVAYRKPFTV